MSARNKRKTADPRTSGRLDTAEVLILDCQTSGPRPSTGHIIEIGWLRYAPHHGREPSRSIETYCVQLPEGAVLPDPVQRVTGISRHDLDSGIPGPAVWEKIMQAARDIVRSNRATGCPAVIHFARFEEPFIRTLHQRSSLEPFPLQCICTHEISRRLFPALPRRGIRALAGLFGQGIEKHRCRDHVAATAVIWRELTAILREKHDVRTIADLRHWLERTPIHVHRYRSYPMDRRKRRSLPDRPGIYRMLRSNGDVLYIGKARSLRKRVNSYFTKRNHHPEHILEMLSQAQGVDITETGSALEAALRESDEIKQHRPPYNRALQATRRTLWFSTPDLRSFDHAPHRGFTRGPFANAASVASLGAIREAMRTAGRCGDERAALQAFALPADHAPEAACIRAGCELFFQQHTGLYSHVPVDQALLLLGKRFWLQRDRECSSDDDEEEPENESRPKKWTPDAVARVIAANVRTGTHALRRAAMMVWLSESTVAWEEQMNRRRYRYMLLFEKGTIMHREQIDRTHDITAPPGHARKFHMRQCSFDLATFDRMRVLLSEMRAVLASGHWCAVRLSPERLLKPGALARMLKWL